MFLTFFGSSQSWMILTLLSDVVSSKEKIIYYKLLKNCRDISETK